MSSNLDSSTYQLLRASLASAVSLHLIGYHSGERTPDASQANLARLGQMLAEHGDDILFRSKRPGDTAKAFNALAEAVATLAWSVPGGVALFGLRFIREVPYCIPADTPTPPQNTKKEEPPDGPGQ